MYREIFFSKMYKNTTTYIHTPTGTPFHRMQLRGFLIPLNCEQFTFLSKTLKLTKISKALDVLSYDTDVRILNGKITIGQFNNFLGRSKNAADRSKTQNS